MINFLDPILNPTVTCDKSAMDGYEAKNLISPNYLERANGFLAYTTIKPPIALAFEFICPVDIHYIVIKSKVGNHKSTGLEVYAKCSNSYVSIGKSVYDEDGIVFLSSRLFSKEKLPPSLPKDYRICFLSRYGNVSHNARMMKIVITRSDRFVPCLGSLEVWGEISRNCPQIIRETVENKYNISQFDSCALLTPLIMDQSNEKSDSVISQSRDHIPEDFKDDLTYELMTIPMTLPSGKTVDRNTLDKHIASEKQFGRKPGDPFTGLKFTNNSKPIMNAALKSRIDMFVLKNSSKPEFFNIARTTGRKEKASSDICCDKDIKRIKLDDGDEISIDTSRFKFKEFNDVRLKCCFVCESTEILFILPCQHIYCRSCLGGICEGLKCKCCNKNFLRSDIERYHI